MGIAGVLLSLGFVGSKLIETSTDVTGLEFLGSYGSAVLSFVAIASICRSTRCWRPSWAQCCSVSPCRCNGPKAVTETS
ncbi:hypothetical protein PDO_4771 [Rhizobium sp. PDO1-076]|nr:hypothetical protein PDO_4771 [Rhizobium sp. PDO1-076]